MNIVVIASLSLLSINNHDLNKEYEECQARIDAMIDAYCDSLKTEPAVPQDFLLKYNDLSEKNIDNFFKDWKLWSDQGRDFHPFTKRPGFFADTILDASDPLAADRIYRCR